MAKPARTNEVKLLGVMRRRRSALLVSTALQATALLVLSLPVMAQPAPNARPTGGAVVAGAAAISQTSNNTVINQSSQRAAVNWQSFDVGSQHAVTFNQPSSTAVTLNRVTGPNPSQIAGRIDANGQVVVVNQSGVTFYQGAQVNTNGLIVTAAGITNRNFMNGAMTFDQPGNPNAQVVNQGSITIKQAGLAALVAPQVANSGVINAKLGHVVLAGARTATLDLYGDGLLSLDVTNQVTQTPIGPDGKAATALVTNTGVIRADGGTVQLTARAADGLVQNLVQAGGKIRTATMGDQTGTVALNGVGGSIVVEGQLSAPGRAPGTIGGNVEVATTGNVVVAPTARINASGKVGGGVVAVGTTLARARGGPAVTSAVTAANTVVAPGAQIRANATAAGNGGNVTVLSTGTTQMNGVIAAKGGPGGGNGGSVEVSGLYLGITTGMIDVSAPLGRTGTILFDPEDLDIVTAGTGDGNVTASGVPVGNPDQNTNITVSASALTALSGNLLIEASRNLTVDAAMAFTKQTAGSSVTVLAGNSLTVNQAISTAGGDLILSAAVQSFGGTTFTHYNAAGALMINATVGGVSTGVITLTAGTGGIALASNVTGTVIDLSTTGGGVAQTSGALTAATLQSSGGVTGTVSLNQSANNIASIGSFAVAGGDFTLADNGNTGNLSVSGPLTATNIALSNANTGTISVAGSIGATAGLTVAAGSGGIQLNTGDVLSGATIDLSASGGGVTQVATGTVVATSVLQSTNGVKGTVNLAGTANNVTSIGSFAVTGGDFLLVDAGNLGVAGMLTANNITLSSPTITATGSIGATTGLTLAAGSGGIQLNTGEVLSGATIDLSATGGGVTQVATGTVAAASVLLSASGVTGTVNLAGTANNIASIGSFAVASGDFSLNDTGNLGVAGKLTANNITLNSPTITATGTIGAATGLTLAAGSGGIQLNTGEVLSGATIDLSATGGGVTQVATGTVVAASVLQSASGVTGAVSLAGTANNIASIGSFAVSGGSSGFALSDDVALTVAGALTAPGNIYLNSTNAAGVTIGLKGSIGAGATNLASIQSGAFTLVTGGTITGKTFELAPNTPGGELTLGAAGAGLSLASLTGIGPTTVRLGAVTLPGAANPTTTAGAITVGGAFGLLGTALELDSGGAITQTAALSAGSLSGVANSIILLSANNAIGTLQMKATAGDIQLRDSVALTLASNSSAGNIFAATSNAGGITVTGSNVAASAGTIGLQADAFDASAGHLKGGIVELAPFTAGLGVTLGGSGGLSISNASFAQIDAGLLRIGAITVPGSGLITTAGSIAIGGAFGATGQSIELDSTGGISESGGAVLSAGTLTGSAGGGVSLGGANVISTIGSFDVSFGSFTLNNSRSLTVFGSLSASATVDLSTTGASGISETAAADVTAGTLQSSLGVGSGGFDLSAGNNNIQNIGSIAVSGGSFSLNDSGLVGTLGMGGPLTASNVTVTGAPAIVVGGSIGASGTVALNAGGIALNNNAIVTGSALNLNSGAGGIALTGNALLGQTGALISLNSPGTISEATTSTIKAATLNSVGAPNGAVSLLSTTNAIGSLGNFAVGGINNGFALADSATLTIGGTVTAPGQIYLQSGSSGGISIAAGGSIGAGTLASLQADAFSNSGSVTGGTFEWAPATSGAPQTLPSLTGIGPLNVRIGAVTLPGSVTPTTTAGSIVISGNFGTPTTNLTLDSLGGISESGVAALTAATLTAGAGDTVSLPNANAIGAIDAAFVTGSGGFVLNDAGELGNLHIVSGVLAPGDIRISGAGGIVIDPGADIATSGTLQLASGNGGIQLNVATLSGKALDLNTTGGGVTTGAGSSITAPTLLSSGGVNGNVLLIGSEAIATLAGFSVTNGNFTLNNDNLAQGLTISGPLTAHAISINDTFALAVSGSIAATTSVSLSSVVLDFNTGAVVTGGTIDLNAGIGGIALNGNALVGNNGAIVDLTTKGSGVGEATTATVIAGTLQSTLGVVGPVNLAGVANNVTTLGNFSVGPASLALADAGNAGNLTVAGMVTGGSIAISGPGTITVPGGLQAGNAVALSAGSLVLIGLVSDGGAGTTSLIATSGSLSDTGTLIAGTLSGSAVTNVSLLGATPTTNKIATITNFSAGGSLTVQDAGPLTIATGGTVFAPVIGLTADSMTISGLVTDGGSGLTSLVANKGTISETGTLVTGTLSGSSAGAVMLLGATPSTNQVATLGNFNAAGFTLDDGKSLSVTGMLAGGPSATIVDNNVLTIAASGTVAGSSISLTGANVNIPGVVTDGGSGTTSLVANAGTINQTGTLIAGTLSGSATGTANFAGSTATTNQIAALGNFSAQGFSLRDGSNLTLNGLVAGGPNLTLVDNAALAMGASGTASANAISLSASSITIAGEVTDGGNGTVNLIAMSGSIAEFGTLIAGTLSGSAPAFVSLTGATPTTNQVANLSGFNASTFVLNDGINLNITSGLIAGTSASVLDSGALTIASGGSVVSPLVNLTGASLGVAGLINAGFGTLVATGGTINETGTLITTFLNGSAAGTANFSGATPTTNQIQYLSGFGASGITLNDGMDLFLAGPITGGPSVTIRDNGALFIQSLVSANAISLTANSISGTGSVITGLLSGSAIGSVALTGAGNQIAQLGAFSGTGFTLNDGSALVVSGPLDGGANATISDSGALTVTGGISATAVGLTGASTTIPGSITAGGTLSLIATNGAITETGTLLAGTLSGSASGSATLTGTNRVPTLGGFTAPGGFTLNDSVALLVNGTVNGGTSVGIADPAALTVGGSIAASAVSLSAASISIPGNVTGSGIASLIANTGTISEAGVLNVGTLSGSAVGAASFMGATPSSNQIAAIGNFTSNNFTLSDGTNLAVNGTVNGGALANVTVAGTLSVPGMLTASTVNINASGGIAVPGTLADANSVSLITSGSITETGVLLADLLTGSAGGGVSLTGSNQVAQLGNFSAGGGFTLRDGTSLTIGGTLTAPRINVNDSGNLLTFANNASVVTSGAIRPTGTTFPASLAPANGAPGAYFQATNFNQVGSSFVAGIGGGPSTLQISVTGNMQFAGLQAPSTWLILNVTGGQINGNVFVNALDISFTSPGAGGLIGGSIGGLTGQAAAGAANIQPAIDSNFRFNSCAVHSVNCVLLPTQGIPTANPLNDINISTLYNPNEEDDLLLPIVSQQDY